MARRVVLTAGSLLASLAILEIAVRAWSGHLEDYPNLVLNARTALANMQASKYVHDDLLGYVPRAGYSSKEVNFDGDGFRLTGNGPPPGGGGGTILAMGDSYTYGDEVTDTETWPSYVQRLSGRRVLNAGVPGYGFDQIVLRTESEAEATHPSVILVGFIADDLNRMEVSRLWGAEKPYFEVVHGELVLRNVPVPERLDPRRSLSLAQRLLGYSYLFDFVLRRLGVIDRWFGDEVRVLPSGEGEKVACLLTERLAEVQRTSGAPVLMVAQYDPYVWKSSSMAAEQRRITLGVLECARRQGLDAIDTFDAISGWHGEGGPAGLYKLWHMNEAGNSLTAGLVVQALQRLHR